MNRFNTLNINSIKKDAKKYRASYPLIKHANALDVVSKEKYGFSNYKHALNYLSKLKKSKNLMTISAKWRDENKKLQFEYCSIILSKPWQDICDLNELQGYRYNREAIVKDNVLTFVNKSFNQSTAREDIRRILKAYQFMDVTGFKPIHLSETTYPESYYGYGVKLPGIDHLCIWEDPISKIHFFTNEPFRNMENSDHEFLLIKENLIFKECDWTGIYHSYSDVIASSKLYIGTNGNLLLEPYLEKINHLENLLANFNTWRIKDSNFYPDNIKARI